MAVGAGLTPTSFVALSMVVAVAALTPGPAVTTIVARAVSDGLRPAMAVNAGVVSGDLLFFVLAAGGMAAAARSMETLFHVLRVAGAGYLVWQGIALWRARPRARIAGGTDANAGDAGHERQFWRNYAAGFLLMLGHVQAMLFYAALLPGFVEFSSLNASDALLLAVMLVVVIGGVNTGYAFLAARARVFFANERAQFALHRVAGTLMLVAAALVLAR
jgi:threonine/homoserine/homoserine lactone efflux protein